MSLPARGSPLNPAGRFQELEFLADPDALEFDEAVEPRTRFIPDQSRSIISRNTSPDIPFDASLNVYRGCEHGCAYCYARPTHEFLGYSAGLDFERLVLVKEQAAALLEAELRKKSWQPTLLMMSGVTDPYQPVERHLRITRDCLQVLLDYRHPVGIITKNHLVTRDIDLLQQLAERQLTSVTLSITTLDEGLRRRLEPRTSTAARRLAAVRKLSDAGIPVHVNVAPIIPALNDHEVPDILRAAAEHGARSASYTIIRLPGAVAEIFQAWLQEHYPERADKVMHRIRSMRGGQVSESGFGSRMRGTGEYAEQVGSLFRVARRKYGLDAPRVQLRTDLFRLPGSVQQPGLF